MKTIPLLLASFTAILISLAAASQQAMAADLQSANEVKLDMRKLWEDHIAYTRNYIISSLAGLPDADTVAKRLMRNQEDIGTAIKPYYGKEAGDKLTALLKDHIAIAADVVKAAKVGDKKPLADAQKKWKGNADDISSFLSSANPHWRESELQEMMHKHLDFTTGEVEARLKKDWDADIKYYDEGHMHMLMFSDMLTEGIAKQFPAKFTREEPDRAMPH